MLVHVLSNIRSLRRYYHAKNCGIQAKDRVCGEAGLRTVAPGNAVNAIAAGSNLLERLQRDGDGPLWQSR
jgi:hypothetical protein